MACSSQEARELGKISSLAGRVPEEVVIKVQDSPTVLIATMQAPIWCQVTTCTTYPRFSSSMWGRPSRATLPQLSRFHRCRLMRLLRWPKESRPCKVCRVGQVRQTSRPSQFLGLIRCPRIHLCPTLPRLCVVTHRQWSNNSGIKINNRGCTRTLCRPVTMKAPTRSL